LELLGGNGGHVKEERELLFVAVHTYGYIGKFHGTRTKKLALELKHHDSQLRGRKE